MTQFAEIARDLVNLEINTILKDNMTAQKMPSVPHVLLDIAIEYLNEMITLGLDPRPYWQTAIDSVGERKVELLEIPKPDDPQGRKVSLWTGKRPTFDTDHLQNGERDFGHLRWLARGLAIHPDFTKRFSEEEQRIHEQVLERITRNCDEIRTIVKALTDKSRDKARWVHYLGKGRREVIQAIQDNGPPPLLDITDAVTIRKIWEVGTERVVLQTVIQVDGDVISRVNRSFATQQSQVVFDIHLHSIKTSVECWRYLLEVVGKLAGRTIDSLVGARG